MQKIFSILFVGWMVVIFLMSGMSASDSGSLSGGATQQIVQIVMPDYESIPELTQISILQTAELLVRKMAHALMYCILGIFGMICMSKFDKILRTKTLIVILFCVAYAITDEFHQMFSEGRSPQVADVLIDTAGAAVGVLIITLIIKWKKQGEE